MSLLHRSLLAQIMAGMEPVVEGAITALVPGGVAIAPLVKMGMEAGENVADSIAAPEPAPAAPVAPTATAPVPAPVVVTPASVTTVIDAPAAGEKLLATDVINALLATLLNLQKQL